MNNKEIIDKTEAFVRRELVGAEGGHDWWHIERVWKLSKEILGDQRDVDPLIVELGALLHDIADSKFHDGDEEKGPLVAQNFLKSIAVPEEIILHIVQIIGNISFKGGNHKQTFRSPELDIIQDADRLDSMGAMGIARTFNYGGFKNRELYNPDIAPNMNMSRHEYKNSKAPTINHFYEKLLRLKERMNTDKGRLMAEERHLFMEQFLTQFFDEWEGKR